MKPRFGISENHAKGTEMRILCGTILAAVLTAVSTAAPAAEAVAEAVAETSGGSLYAVFLSANAATRRAWMDDADMRKRMAADGTPPCGAPECGVPQWYSFPGIENMRDFGGWKGLDGRRIRKGLVLRLARFEGIKGKSAFRERFGVKTDLDLRDREKMSHLKGKSPLGDGVELVIEAGAPSYAAWDTKSGRKYFRDKFALFCDRAKYPIAIHCHKGADRTGSLVFLLQGLLGVAEEDQHIDWQLTAFCFDNPQFRDADRYDKLAAFIALRDGATWTDKFVAYAHDCGVTDEEIATFREIMLEDAAK